MSKREKISRSRINGVSWEEELFGIRLSARQMTGFPEYLDFRASMREIIIKGCYGQSAGIQDYQYDPKKPKPGTSRELWRDVLKHLPCTKGTKYGIPKERLFLYLAIGQTSLDVWHGVDAFFHWQTACVTIDASTVFKKKEVSGDMHLKADFVLMPQNTDSSDNLICLGAQIAALLMKRVLDPESHKRFRSVLPLYHLRGVNIRA